MWTALYKTVTLLKVFTGVTAYFSDLSYCFFGTYCVFSVQGLDLVEDKIAIPHVPGVKREQFQLVPPDVSLYPSVFAYLANHTTPNSEDLGGGQLFRWH